MRLHLLLPALVLPALFALLPALDGAPAPAGGAKKLTNSIGMKLVLIPKGAFTMGAPDGEGSPRLSPAISEQPQHKVEITRPFYMGVYEVTQQEYQKVTGTNPSWHRAGGSNAASVSGLDTQRFPVENVNWFDAVNFCKKLSALPREKGARRVYRLPSEAEWEYACRAGTKTPFAFGKSLSSRQANFDGKHPYGGAPPGKWLGRTAKVGSYKPNAWGLYDMHGNVWEWTADWSGRYSADEGVVRDPEGPIKGPSKIFRGGSWCNPASYCRSALRYPAGLSAKNDLIGFRVACVVGGR
jgi:formylglycine-generating enzyme required for sulfatase activity